MKLAQGLTLSTNFATHRYCCVTLTLW